MTAAPHAIPGDRAPLDRHLILGLEVGGDHLSVALLAMRPAARGPAFELLDESTLRRTDPRESSVLTAVDQCLARHGVAPRALSLVAVPRGPGSFTGIRVGLSVGLGLSLGANVPVWPVCSLASLASQAVSPGHVLALLDARKGEVYGALFAVGNGPPEVVLAPTLGTCEAVTAQASFALSEVVGDGARYTALGSGALAHGLDAASSGVAHTPRASSVAWLAAMQWWEAEFDAGRAPPVDAVYLRPSEAEIAFKSG